MDGYRCLMRRKLLHELYDRLTPEEKRTFVKLTTEGKDHQEIMTALQELKKTTEANRHSFASDLIANVSGNAIFDGAVWFFSRLMRRF